MAPKRKNTGRSSNGYNLFCSTLKLTGTGIGEFGKKWKALSAKEKQEWNKKTNRETTDEKMNDRQKNRFFKKHLNNIKYSCTQLEKINVESSGLSIFEGVVHLFGSQKTVNWMEENYEFQQKFAISSYAREKTPRTDNNKRESLRKVVQELFNTKYAECFGSTGGKVPYKSNTFYVEGLPDGVSFSKPSQYGINKMRKILRNKDKIKFRRLQKGKNAEEHSQDAKIFSQNKEPSNKEQGKEAPANRLQGDEMSCTDLSDEINVHSNIGQGSTSMETDSRICADLQDCMLPNNDEDMVCNLNDENHLMSDPSTKEGTSKPNFPLKYSEYSTTKRKSTRPSFPRKKITKWGYIQW